MSRESQKKIAVINDFCGFGRCSIAVSLPILSTLKIQCCPLPTSIFSNHTAFESFFFTDYTEHMEDYVREWEKLELHFDGILTGYLGSPEQIDTVKRFLERFKTKNTTAVIDPVMGDGGVLYSAYSKELSKKMCSLVPYADILTPNLTEACILTDTEYKKDMRNAELTAICEKLCKMGPETVVVSGLEKDGILQNFIYRKEMPPVVIGHKRVGPCRAGTGDVFSSIIAGDTVNGKNIEDAVRHASDFISRAMEKTIEMDMPATDGICFEEVLTEI